MYGPNSLITLEPGESILLHVRRHLFVFYTRIVFLVFLFFIPLVGAVLWYGASDNNIPEGGVQIFAFFFLIWLLVLWTLFIVRWTDYYLDVWIVTNTRIIDIEQKGIFNVEVSTFRLENVQDVTVEIRGPIATFLGFGDIHIHTAGEARDFIIRDAANPLAVKDTLVQAHGNMLDTVRVKSV